MAQQPKASLESVIAHCPKCEGDRTSDVLGEHTEEVRSPNFDADTSYRILKCRGCSHVQFQTVSTNSEHTDHVYDSDTGEEYNEYVETQKYFPPIAKRQRPDWARRHPSYSPAMIYLLDEAYEALDCDLSIVAAIALRTVFDAATEVLGIDPALSFKKKLARLVADGHISTFQRDTLDALTDAGSAAAHRGWKPSEQELHTMFSIMETFLHQAFVNSLAQKELAARAAELRKRTPRRQY